MSEISEVLRPYGDFETSDVAHQLAEIVPREADLLKIRNILGPLARYAQGYDTAYENAFAAQLAEIDTNKVNELGARLVVSPDDPERIIGAVSVQPKLALRELHVPLPPGIARGPLATAYPYATPNFQAWTIEGMAEVLPQAYQEVFDLAGSDKYQIPVPGSDRVPAATGKRWTIESVKSPAYVHEAVMGVEGIQRVIARRFDDQESRFRHVPPESVLYAELESPEVWGGDKKLEELRTGFPWVGDSIYDLT